MDEGTALGISAVTDLAIALAYAYAGVLLLRRAYGPGSQRAGAMFALWWFGIAATGLLSMTLVLLARAGASPRAIDAVDQASLAAFALALIGFTSYVAFIHFGSYRADLVIVPGYAALVLWSLASALASPATGYHTEMWRPIVERPPSFGPPPMLMSILLLSPLLVAAAAYASLYRRAVDADARFRVRVVTGAFVSWLVGVSIVSFPVGGVGAAQVTGRTVILLSAALLVIAYRPPTRVRAWLGHADAHAALARARAHLDDRTRELV